MVKEAITSKHAILSAIMAFRAISGETKYGGGILSSTGVRVITSKSGVAEFKIRAGLPFGVKVELKGEKMYEFIGTLVDFVLPRIREFSGVVMPAPTANASSPSMTSGVVSIGLPPTAMGLFPQIEINLDSYPTTHGLHIQFITNARGKGAQNRARALLSGFQIPFARR
jgi:large subunit ribosomal protein L5